MKKVKLLMMALMMCFVSNLTFGQMGLSQKNYEEPIYEEIVLSPGDELIKASNHFYIGNGLIIGGSLITLGANTIKPDNYNSQPKNLLTGVGIGVATIGLILVFESHIHTRRAGLLLNEYGVGVKVNINK